MKPILFDISQTRERLVSQSGLALAGALLGQTQLRQRMNAVYLAARPEPEICHGDVVLAMTGLLCIGKTDFDAIEAFRNDSFFRAALGLARAPSEGTLRQRIEDLAAHDPQGGTCIKIILEESAELAARCAPKLKPSFKDYVVMDVDVSVLDNSGTKKEGVSRTYQGMDGYAPIFAHLGEEGYLIHAELREGSQHCQKQTPKFLKEALAYAQRVTKNELLVRMDAGHDAVENIRVFHREKVRYIIKRNIRKEPQDEWLEIAQAHGSWSEPREGKTVWRGETWREIDGLMPRVVFEVTQRTILSDGQRLLGEGEIEVETYWTNLKASPEEVIALYHAHGTSEQFHAEFKSDLGLERMPSGKFAANAMLFQLGLLAYNVLRLIGQNGLAADRKLPQERRAPLRKKVGRRRVRSVMQDMMYMAARLTRHAGRWGLSFWAENPWRGIWESLYARFTRLAHSTG